MTFFRAENLAIQFGGLRAVDGVSFEVREGEVYSIIGPNGAGKTTVFNLISRIYDPSAGRMVFQERDITGVPPHRIAGLGIARTFQNIELFQNSTVLQNLLLGRHEHRRSNLFSEMLFLPHVRRMEVAHREKVEEVIEFLGLQHHRESRVSGLPYGIAKVVELGRALCTEPKLLLLDEPAAGMNLEEVKQLDDRLRALRDSGKTILLVEHVMELVMEVTDRVAVLNFGRKIAEGTPSEIQDDATVREAYLGTA